MQLTSKFSTDGDARRSEGFFKKPRSKSDCREGSARSWCRREEGGFLARHSHGREEAIANFCVEDEEEEAAAATTRA